MTEDSNHAADSIAFAPVLPASDLWPGIEAAVRPRRHRLAWMSGGLAASMALAMTLTMTSAPQVAQQQANELQRVAAVMQLQQRAGLGAVASAVQAQARADTLQTLHVAEQEIREAIDQGSLNPALLTMLARVHRQQLAITNRSMKV